MNHTPLDIAKEAERLGRNSDNKAFQQITMICLGATAAASMGHLFLGLLRELNRREERRGWSR
jgi:hypothetical protein